MMSSPRRASKSAVLEGDDAVLRRAEEHVDAVAADGDGVVGVAHPRKTEAASTRDTLTMPITAETKLMPSTRANVAQRICGYITKGHAFLDHAADGLRHAGAEAEADEAGGERLHEEHAGDDAHAGAHGLDGGEIFQVLEDEGIERLPGDRDAHEEAEEHRGAEGERDAGVGPEPPEGVARQAALAPVPDDRVGRPGLQPRVALDAGRRAAAGATPF
jgi:hypothetical protein